MTTARRFAPFFSPQRLIIATALAALFLPAIARADLASTLRGKINAVAPAKSSVAVSVRRLDDAGPTTLFTHRSDEAMIPASNLKVLTSAAALHTLGEDFRFRTRLYVRVHEDGTHEAAVVGDGDPSFGDAELLRGIDGWGTRTVFESWANALKASGITRIERLRLDDSVFDDAYEQPNWPDNQRHLWYEAQVSGLNLNMNCLDVHLRRGSGSTMLHRLDPPTEYVTVENTCRRGSRNAVWLSRERGSDTIILKGQTNASEQGPMRVTVENPTSYFGTVMAETLTAAGIEVGEVVTDRTVRSTLAEPALSRGPAQGDDPNGGAEAGDWDALDEPAWHLLAVHETPLSTVLARTNKDSINLYAEALLKRTAFEITGEPGSWQAGEAAVKEFLTSLDVKADPVQMDDGSGMSRLNRVTANAMTGVLAAMFNGEHFETFRVSLSEAGADGTLESRFRDSDRSDLQGRVFGKTGYIDGVSTFTAYLHGRDGRWYAVSVLVNDVPGGQVWKAKQLQEDVVLALDKSLDE